MKALAFHLLLLQLLLLLLLLLGGGDKTGCVAAGLRGEIAQARGDLDTAINEFEAAVAIEDLANYVEPPAWAQPMRHYLGAALLDAGRPAEAEAVYRRDLRCNAENGWSLVGLYQSLAGQGKKAEAKEAYARYQSAWQHSDTALISSRM